MDDSKWCGYHWSGTRMEDEYCAVHTETRLHEFHPEKRLKEKFGIQTVFYCPVEWCTHVKVLGYTRSGMLDQTFRNAINSMRPRILPMEIFFEALVKETRDNAVCIAVAFRKSRVRECAEK